MLVAPSAMTTFVIKSASNTSHNPLSQMHCGIVTVLSPVHPMNALSPTFVTLPGISMLVNNLQSANASTPMLVTLVEIDTLRTLLQPSNAPSPIPVTG